MRTTLKTPALAPIPRDRRKSALTKYTRVALTHAACCILMLPSRTPSNWHTSAFTVVTWVAFLAKWTATICRMTLTRAVGPRVRFLPKERADIRALTYTLIPRVRFLPLGADIQTPTRAVVVRVCFLPKEGAAIRAFTPTIIFGVCFLPKEGAAIRAFTPTIIFGVCFLSRGADF